MDTKHLHTFLTLCKIRNFTKTAELLGYAQSSITAQIKQLETELNVQLFDRIGKTVSVTSAGKALIPYASQIISLSADMKEVVSDTDILSGKITVGAAESICIYRLPKIINYFRKMNPNAEIYLKLFDSSDAVSLLSDNTIDIAFVIGSIVDDPSIISVLRIPERTFVLSYPDHPLSSQSSISQRDFFLEPFVLTESGCCYRKAFEHDMLSMGVKINTILETGSIQAIKEMTMSGLGLCVLPEIAVLDEINSNRMIPLPYESNYEIYSQLIYHKSKWVSPLLSRFIEAAKKVTAENFI